MSPEREPRGVGLITARHFTFIWSFHFCDFVVNNSPKLLIILLKSRKGSPLKNKERIIIGPAKTFLNRFKML